MARLFINAAAVACLVVFAALLPREPAEVDRMTTGSVEPASPDLHGFQLNAPGGESCRIGDRQTGAGDRAEISLDPGCAKLFPELADVRFWRDEADGSMALAGADGHAIVRFAQADGAGYESYFPKLPLLSLTPVQ
ncbi:MAG: hypothetical protein JNL61_10700 [Rhizobiaceae bacterium]|nr:hypothetical protein [Rhizobiaceae bacterium]